MAAAGFLAAVDELLYFQNTPHKRFALAPRRAPDGSDLSTKREYI